MPFSGPKITKENLSRLKVIENYDKMSKWYDIFTGPEKQYIYYGLQILQVTEGDKVLEIGFGTGDALIKLAQSAGDSGKVYGIDISEGMFNVAESKLKKSGLLENIDLVLGDAIQLPFENEFFDVLFMSFTLELFNTSEIPVILSQCLRVLKKGGKMGVVALSDRGDDNLMTKIYKWANQNFPDYVDCRPILTLQELKKAGFFIKKEEELTMWGLPVDVVVAEK